MRAQSIHTARLLILAARAAGTLYALGGPGSGNFGHAGRPGEVGGSAAATEPNLYDVMSELAFRNPREQALASRITGYSADETKQGIADRIRLWTETTNGTPDARRLQQAVADEFDLKAVNRVTDTPTDFDRQFVRAEYEATQQWLKDQGITHLTVYRGMLSGLPVGSGDTQVTMQPASSWSVSSSTAWNFAQAGGRDGGVIATRVPTSRVLSTAVTGRGSVSEGEVILLGGKLNVQLRPRFL